MPEKTLILGLGNILLRDEGLGIHLVERLRKQYRFPDEVQIVDGGTLGLDLLPYFDGVGRLLVVDAVTFDAEPGHLIRLEGDAIPFQATVKVSPHQAGLQDLLAVARLQRRLPPTVVVWGMEPASFHEWGMTLTAAVEASLPALMNAVLEELRSWGINSYTNPLYLPLEGEEICPPVEERIEVGILDAGRIKEV
jgi:hydrogenase maturation protease